MPKVTYRAYPGAEVRVIGPMVDGAAYRGAQALRGRAMSNIRGLGRVNTGEMIGGLQVRLISKAGLSSRYSVSSSAKHTVFQEEGTRAHGPARAQFLVFTPKGSGKVVFAKWVRGVTPGHFMRNAMNQARVQDFAM